MAATTIRVELVTPVRRLFATEAASVTFTGLVGEMTVMPGHIAMITGLKPGPLSITQPNGHPEIYAVGGGVAQIDGDKVVIMAESAESAAEIDVTRAEAAAKAAEQALRDKSFYDETFAEAQAAFGRATTRLAIAKKQ